MTFSIQELAKIYQLNPRSICHIGAHRAEELSDYQKHFNCRVDWFEANPDLFKEIEKLSDSKNFFHQAILWSEPGLRKKFIVANNSQSSSLFKMSKHSEIYPEIFPIKEFFCTTTVLEEYIEHVPDFLSVDTQGAELEILKGISRINQVSWILCEVNVDELYVDNPLLSDIDSYLNQFGFERIASRIHVNGSWGDALYANKTIISYSIVRFLIFKILDLKWIVNQFSYNLKLKLRKKLNTKALRI